MILSSGETFTEIKSIMKEGKDHFGGAKDATSGKQGTNYSKGKEESAMRRNDAYGWSSECPTTPGVYEFRRSTTSWIDKVEIFRMKGLLFGKLDGISISLSGFDSQGSNPQWRPLRTSETPLTDAAEYPASTFANAPDDVKVVNSDLARMLETKIAEAESELAIARNRIKQLAEEGTKVTLHALELGVTAGNSVLERDAWKSVAERLEEACNPFIGASKGAKAWWPYRDPITEALAELERLRKGES